MYKIAYKNIFHPHLQMCRQRSAQFGRVNIVYMATCGLSHGKEKLETNLNIYNTDFVLL